MSERTVKIISCDVKGCKASIEIPSDYKGLYFERGWAAYCFTLCRSVEPEDNRWQVACPDHAEQINAVLAGKKARSDKGKPRKTSQEGPNSSNLVASGAGEVVPATPTKKRDRKQAPIVATESEIYQHMKVDPNVCEPGKPTFAKCPNCKERHTCTKDGGASLDCYSEKSKGTGEK